MTAVACRLQIHNLERQRQAWLDVLSSFRRDSYSELVRAADWRARFATRAFLPSTLRHVSEHLAEAFLSLHAARRSADVRRSARMGTTGYASRAGKRDRNSRERGGQRNAVPLFLGADVRLGTRNAIPA